MKYNPKMDKYIEKAVDKALSSISDETLMKMSWFSTIEEKKVKEKSKV